MTRGLHMMEMITRARTHLAVILADRFDEQRKTREHFFKAEKKGLVNIVHLGASNGNGSVDEDDKFQATNTGRIDDKSPDMFLCSSRCNVL